MDKRTARLLLKTHNLTTESTNLGVTDVYRQNHTWYNINLRTLLGDLYDKYDYFNLKLISIVSDDTTGGIDVTNDLYVNVKMTGLPFVNQTYDVNNKCNTNVCYLSHHLFFTDSFSITEKSNDDNIVFGKNQELVNINIFYTKLIDDLPFSGDPALDEYGDATFLFSITGVDK